MRLSRGGGPRTLLAINRDIQEPKPREVLLAWRKAVLSVSFVFELMEEDMAAYWRSVSLREALITDHAQMSRTGMQKAIAIYNFKTSKAVQVIS